MPPVKDLLGLARRLGQSLKPGFQGTVPAIEQTLTGSPKMAESLGTAASSLPKIPPRLSGVMDTQDLLQEAMLGIHSTPGLASDPAALQKYLQSYVSKMGGAGGAPMGVRTVPAEAAEGAVSRAMVAPSRARAKLPEAGPGSAGEIRKTLTGREEALMKKLEAGGKPSPADAGVLSSLRRRLGTAKTGTMAGRMGATEGPVGFPLKGKAGGLATGPARQVTEPAEIDRALAAYNRLFQQPAEPITAPKVKAGPPRRKTPKAPEEGGGFFGKAKDAPLGISPAVTGRRTPRPHSPGKE